MAVPIVAMQVQAVQVAVVVHVAGQAIARRLPRDGRAQRGPFTQPGQAQAAGFAAALAAVHPTAARPALTHAVVARIAGLAAHVQQHRPAPAGQPESARFFARAAVGAQADFAFEPIGGRALRQAPVHHVDDTAHRARCLQQSRRAAEQLNALGQHGLGGHGVVGAHGRCIFNGRAVAQQRHARAIQPTHDGAAGACAKVRGLHAGLTGQRVAQIGCAAFAQALGVHQGFGPCALGALRRGRHGHFGQRAARLTGWPRLGHGRQAAGAGQQSRQGRHMAHRVFGCGREALCNKRRARNSAH